MTDSPVDAKLLRRQQALVVMWLLWCMLAGVLQAASLAWPILSWTLPGTAPGQASGAWQLVSLGMGALALQHSRTAIQGFWRGWLFATTWLAGTFWWLFISMHTYGGLPAVLAVLAVLALAGALGLYYAGAAALVVRFRPASRLLQAVLFAACWTLAELARGRWFTGFPWGAGGYAQVDLLGVWAPWVGVYGLGFIAAFVAYALASVCAVWVERKQKHAVTQAGWQVKDAWITSAFGLLLLVCLFWGVKARDSLNTLAQQDTAPTGDLRVWLLQGNIAQDEKFVAGVGVARALGWYPQQINQALDASRQERETVPLLVVAPETALPMLPQQLPASFWRPVLDGLAQPGQGNSVNVLIGLPLGSYAQGYTNSAWGLDAAMAVQARAQVGGLADPKRQAGPSLPHPAPFYQYDKHHLVPFGEFIPPLFRWFTDLMHIPLGDFNRGRLAQAPWKLAGQRVAPNICYEDLFGEELAAGFRNPASAPTVLVNMSNIAWFGDSIAIDQHLQISRLRAMELGRPMLRATNTGATAVIDHRGVVTAQLQRLTQGRLEATVQGRSGTTPFARWASRWGVLPVWGLCLGLVMLITGVSWLSRRGSR